MKHVRWIVIAAGAAAVVGMAAPAHADIIDSESQFLNTVEQAGIEYTDPQDAIAVGRQVCDYLHAGHPANSAARALKISNRSLSVKNAARFVVFAQSAFCPQLDSRPDEG